MQFYRIAGLSVASEIALPGMINGTIEHSPEVIIRRGPVPESLPAPDSVGSTWQLADGQFLLHIRNIARFLLNDGREIVVEPESTAAAADVPVFILGTVFGLLLHQRGQIVLHASAVRVNGKAVIFGGPSGSGKSLLAAALAMRGYPLIADDICAIAVADTGPPILYPDGRKLKLWAKDVNRLGLSEQCGQRVRSALDKHYVEIGEGCSEPLRIAAIYRLREARPPMVPGIVRPNPVDLALLLRRTAYRPLMVRRLDQKAIYFNAAAAVARSAGIFNLTRVLDFSKLQDLIALLERHWLDQRLMEEVA